MFAASLAAALAAIAADPCTPVEPAEEADRATDASDAPCRTATATAASSRAEEELDEAAIGELARMVESGDCEGALRWITEMTASRSEPVVALFEGSCLFERGDLREARRALEHARTEPQLAESADLLLAVIAYREADAETVFSL